MCVWVYMCVMYVYLYCKYSRVCALTQRLKLFITATFDQKVHGEVAGTEPLGHLFWQEGT